MKHNPSTNNFHPLYDKFENVMFCATKLNVPVVHIKIDNLKNFRGVKSFDYYILYGISVR